MGVTTSRRIEIAEGYERFKANPDNRNMRIEEAMEKFNVSRTVIRKWRQRSGFLGVVQSEMEDKLRRLREHPGFGVKGEPAPCAAKDLEFDTGLSASTINAHRRHEGVLVSKHLRGISPMTRLAPVTELIESWGRPNGIQEHLDYLREMR